MRLSSTVLAALTVFMIAVLIGCGARNSATPSVQAHYVDPTRTDPMITGLGFEPQDIIAMCSRMVSDMLANPNVGNQASPPRVIIDETRFVNESVQMSFNLHILLDRIRAELLRASSGRILFVSRTDTNLVNREKADKTAGMYNPGTRDNSLKVAGADFLLVGRITSMSSSSNSTGLRSNFFTFFFELLDLNSGYLVWASEPYDIRKAGADDVIYR